MGKSQQQKETPQEIALAEVAQARMADFKKRWQPLVSKLSTVVRADGASGSAARRLAAGKATTDNEARFGQARGQLESGLAAGGAAPSSGKFKTAVMGLGDDQATSRALGMVASDEAVTDAYVQGLGKIAAMGRGQSAGAIQGMGQVANQAARQAQADAEAALAERAGKTRLAGQVAGFGLAGGFSGAGDKLQAGFSQTGMGSSGFGTGLAYGNRDIGEFI